VRDGDLDLLLDRLPSCRNRQSVAQLHGGLTNVNYRIATTAGEVVARISSADGSLLAIDRDAEESNARTAADTGIAPAVLDRLIDPPVLVVRYIESLTLDAAALRSGDHLGRIATSLRTLHGGPPFRGRFDMFDIAERYLRIAHERDLLLPPRYLDHAPIVERIRTTLERHPEDLVSCHNDLLAENFLWDGNAIWIIDFEYSGLNEPSFELGNLAAESDLDDDGVRTLLAAYWRADDGSALVAHKAARSALWGLVARYGWTLWALISESINPLDFDFRGWGLEKYDAFEVAVADVSRLDDLIRRAGTSHENPAV